MVGAATIDCLSFAEAIEEICRLATGQSRTRLVVTPNIHHITALPTNPSINTAYAYASPSLPDGWPVAVATGYAAGLKQERIAGANLLPAVCRAAAKSGLTVAFAGGGPCAAMRCADAMSQQFPNLKVDLVDPLPLGFERSPGTVRRFLDDVVDAQPTGSVGALTSLATAERRDEPRSR